MKLLVTGSAGFIGSAVVREALLSQAHTIIGVDCLTYAGNLDSTAMCKDHANNCFERVDVCNANEVRRVLGCYEPDAIMHLAAESHVDRSIDSPEKFISTNVNGTFILLEAFRHYYKELSLGKKQRFRFHHISTDGTCQPQRDTLLTINSLLALRAAPAAWGNSPDHRSSPQAQGAPD